MGGQTRQSARKKNRSSSEGTRTSVTSPGDPNALAEGLARLIDDPALRHRLGEAARLDVLAHHTWRAHVRKTIDAVESRAHAQVA